MRLWFYFLLSLSFLHSPVYPIFPLYFLVISERARHICNIFDWTKQTHINELTNCKLLSLLHTIFIGRIFEERKLYDFKISPFDKTLRSYDQNMFTAFKHRANLLAGCTFLLYGPRQANLCLRAFRHDKFWLRMPSHSEGPGIWLSVWRFRLTHCLYERVAEVQARLRGCAGSPDPSLLA